jgi:hypothetical protein
MKCFKTLLLQNGEWTVGNWHVKDYVEVASDEPKSSYKFGPGDVVSPVLVVVDANCRELLTSNASLLLTYTDGASPMNFGIMTETSDSENAMTVQRYEQEMEARAERCILGEKNSKKTTASQGNNPVASKVSSFLCLTMYLFDCTG